MDNWRNLFIFLLSMGVTIYSVYETFRSCESVCLPKLITKYVITKIAAIRVSKIPQRTMVNGSDFCCNL